MSDKALLKLPDGKTLEMPIVVGTENEKAIDIAKLRSETGYITLDPAYGNTGSCTSDICYIDGEAGILRYRGYPIEQLAEQSSFVEVAYMLIWGKLPNEQELAEWSNLLGKNAMLHEGLRFAFNSIPQTGHPMATLSSMINAMSCYHPDVLELKDEAQFMPMAAKLLSKVRTIAAFSYRQTVGHPIRYPKPHLDYCANFLHMMFSIPYSGYEPDPDVAKALNQILILHAEHEQNCSTSTVRMVGSSGANLFTSCAAGVCALWGPLHGGANVAVLDMLERIRGGKTTVKDFMAKVKSKEEKLMGFGHRVYKNFDPRAKILKDASVKVLAKLGVKDPLLDIARELEEIALADDYFISRKLYPNVDFYSGIIMRAMGLPTNMFTVMFAIGRMPGWIAHWYEVYRDPNSRINRPRQIYTGPTRRDYVPMDKRS
ncbi:MAG: citrate synthase [Planctomycetes bacterium]|nr:citrate synthase [Planctomycetota bacterium]